LPSFCSGGGRIGAASLNFSVRYQNASSVTGMAGQPRESQSGISSLMPRGSITAPEMPCAPISFPFSSTAMETPSSFVSAADAAPPSAPLRESLCALINSARR
jgi:hypothetical protein